MSSIWTNDAPGEYEANQAQRSAFFNKIAPQPNWKVAIDCWIDVADVADCSEAAIFFTGAPLACVETKDGRAHVTAPGYYATIGA